MSYKYEAYHSRRRPEMLDYIPQFATKILDVGCGEGVFGLQLKQRQNAEVWGVEIQSDAATVANQRIDRCLTGDISLLVGDLPVAFFNCIIFNDILEHLVDPFDVLSRIKPTLSAHGVFVCSIPNVRYYYTLKELLFRKQWQYKDSGVLDKTHLRFFTKKSIIDMFTSLGCKIVRIDGINKIASWKIKLLNILLFGYLSDTLYLQFACVAKPE